MKSKQAAAPAREAGTYDNCVITSSISIISDEMRIVVENEWPELIHKPPRDDDPPRHLGRLPSSRSAWPSRAH
jgi:hypothetical protein